MVGQIPLIFPIKLFWSDWTSLDPIIQDDNNDVVGLVSLQQNNTLQLKSETFMKKCEERSKFVWEIGLMWWRRLLLVTRGHSLGPLSPLRHRVQLQSVLSDSNSYKSLSGLVSASSEHWTDSNVGLCVYFDFLSGVYVSSPGRAGSVEEEPADHVGYISIVI